MISSPRAIPPRARWLILPGRRRAATTHGRRSTPARRCARPGPAPRRRAASSVPVDARDNGDVDSLNSKYGVLRAGSWWCSSCGRPEHRRGADRRLRRPRDGRAGGPERGLLMWFGRNHSAPAEEPDRNGALVLLGARLALAPDNASARELFVRYARKDCRLIALLRAVDEGGGSCVVETQVHPQGRASWSGRGRTFRRPAGGQPVGHGGRHGADVPPATSRRSSARRRNRCQPPVSKARPARAGGVSPGRIAAGRHYRRNTWADRSATPPGEIYHVVTRGNNRRPSSSTRATTSYSSTCSAARPHAMSGWTRVLLDDHA